MGDPAVLFVDLDRDWATALLERELAGAGGEFLGSSESFELAARQYADRLPDVTILSPFVSSPVGAAELDRLPALRLIATRSTGFDHVDVEEARRRGIAVAHVPDYGDNTVAEHTFALVLSLSRKLRQTYERVRREEFAVADLEGFDLRGKTLGVVGTGRIGLRVIQIARGFSMDVQAADTRPQELLADILGFRYRSFDEVVADADILTLHAPLTPRTRHLVDAGVLARMKPGALLVNTSRGGLVDTDALLAALRSGHLGGAGLDVVEEESMLLDEDQARAGLQDAASLRTTVLNHLLLKRDDVVFTPHLAFNSHEANERIYRTTAANVRSFLAGEPRNLVGGASG